MSVLLVVGLVVGAFVVLSIVVGGYQAIKDERAGKPDRYEKGRK